MVKVASNLVSYLLQWLKTQLSAKTWPKLLSVSDSTTMLVELMDTYIETSIYEYSNKYI